MNENLIFGTNPLQNLQAQKSKICYTNYKPIFKI